MLDATLEPVRFEARQRPEVSLAARGAARRVADVTDVVYSQHVKGVVVLLLVDLVAQRTDHLKHTAKLFLLVHACMHV